MSTPVGYERPEDVSATLSERLDRIERLLAQIDSRDIPTLRASVRDLENGHQVDWSKRAFEAFQRLDKAIANALREIGDILRTGDILSPKDQE